MNGSNWISLFNYGKDKKPDPFPVKVFLSPRHVLTLSLINPRPETNGVWGSTGRKYGCARTLNNQDMKRSEMHHKSAYPAPRKNTCWSSRPRASRRPYSPATLPSLSTDWLRQPAIAPLLLPPYRASGISIDQHANSAACGSSGTAHWLDFRFVWPLASGTSC